MNSRNSSGSARPDPQKEFADYAVAAKSLESPQLVFLLAFNFVVAEKYPRWDGREERREILRKELRRRAINPDGFTMEDFRMVFRPCRIKEEEREQQLRACISLVQRAVSEASAVWTH